VFSQITVAVLPAWIIPTWIFCRATISPPRDDTRRCTVIGPPGCSGRDRPRRAPRSRERRSAGTGQAKVRSSVPSWLRTAIKGPSMRKVTRCPVSGRPTLICWSPGLTPPVALTVRSTSITAPSPAGSGEGARGAGAVGGQPGQLRDPEPGWQGLDPGAIEQHMQADRIGSEGDLPPGQDRAKPGLLPADPQVPRGRDDPVHLHRRLASAPSSAHLRCWLRGQAGCCQRTGSWRW